MALGAKLPAGALAAVLLVVPLASSAETAAPPETGREIFDRFLKNRFRAALVTLRITSTDPGGSSQETRLRVRWRDYRVDDAIEGGVAYVERRKPEWKLRVSRDWPDWPS